MSNRLITSPVSSSRRRVASMTACGASPSTSGHSSSNPAPSGALDASRTGRSNSADSATSRPGSSLRSTDPSGKVTSTGGGAVPSRVSVTNRAEHSSSADQRRGTFALATSPVASSSTAYARSPTTPAAPMRALVSDSPSMDFTGYRYSAATVMGPGPARRPRAGNCPVGGVGRVVPHLRAGGWCRVRALAPAAPAAASRSGAGRPGRPGV